MGAGGGRVAQKAWWSVPARTPPAAAAAHTVHPSTPKLSPPVPAQVFSIREAATRALARLATEFGPEWAAAHLVPPVVAGATHPHYLHRETVLAAVAALAPAVGHDVLAGTLLPAVVACAQDKAGQ